MFILPSGEQRDGVNQDGIDYYNRLINELKANDIEPMVTLFHWDLPQGLQVSSTSVHSDKLQSASVWYQDRYGGLLNNNTTNSTVIHDLFGDYARFCFQNFGDRVKFWITFNDPWIITLEGYGIGNYPPQHSDPAEGQYIAGHNIILSHAKAYHIYSDEFRAAQNGKVSIALSCDWGEPAGPSDVEAAEHYVQFFLGWFAHPIYKNGDYPEVMKATMARKGREEGRNTSRLPEFTPEQKAYINQTSDFFALNYYTTVEVTDVGHIVTDNPSWFTDIDVKKSRPADWPQTPFSWLYIVPWGIRKVLGFIRNEYGDPDVYITENGRPDHDRDPAIMIDMDRICSYMMHTNEVMKAVNMDNVKVKAYTAWSLMDGFEWAHGYTVRFGLYYVDFNDPDRTRYPKASSVFFKQLVRNNGYPEGSEFTKYVENMWYFCHNTTETEVNGLIGGASRVSSLFSLFLAMLLAICFFFNKLQNSPRAWLFSSLVSRLEVILPQSLASDGSIMEPGKFVSFLLAVTLALSPANGAYDKERDALLKGTFPNDFIWSSATAAYQIEGAWNASNKGESIWDRLAHEGKVNNQDTGDVACDSYNKYPEDVQLMKQMGLRYYRFSISWPRIFPTGEQQDGVNQDGVDYYNNLINELIANNIQPMVTLFHWDLPQVLQDRYGGFLNNHTTNSTVIHDLFGDYARFLYRNYGDRVKYWITFNETWISEGNCNFAPQHNEPATGQYKAAHNIILSHAKAYRIYDDEFRAAQQGKVGITLNCDWGTPKTPADADAALRYVQFFLGWFAHPIYKNGDYPEVMKTTMARKAQEEGRTESRLPEFTAEQKTYISGTSDFFGLNHYTTVEVTDTCCTPIDNPNYDTDKDVGTGHASDWPQAASVWLYVVPWGIRNLLGWIKEEYGDPEIYVTENGRSDHDQDPAIMMDMERICYYMMYTNEVMKAANLDNVKVKAYTAWSLLDNFEWLSGYSERFGLHYVDFNDPDRTRYPKASSVFFKQLVRNNGYPEGAEFTKYVENMWYFCHNTTEAEVNGLIGGASQVSSMFSLFLAIPMVVVYCFTA
ncbi:lactase-phlorizin hydrolase-like [Branchiostoma floridae]|uniref:beta-glucosidase n=1 Tax=Branchiostoma floridae TaxID=7739 RepID=A0A9J7HRW7_BRAFL|nr:lactase-phlorizin hydrolase-like [Branchiostoma floridae]